MEKTYPFTTEELYDKWLKADKAKMDFWLANAKCWDEKADEIYLVLHNQATELFYKWKAVSAGKSVEQVAYEINESINSRFD